MHKKSKNMNKRAQHEIVGFILIVVIVVVIGLFLLVFYLRQEPVEQKSLDIQNFLQASMDYTTDCAISFEPQYETLQDLIKSSYRNQKCLNDKMAIDVLNETLTQILEQSWQASPERPVNSYSLIIYYDEPSESESAGEGLKDEILSIQKGNCTGAKTGAQEFVSYPPGNIITDMEICYT